MNLEETWKDIPGYPGYQASDHGRIRSVDKTEVIGSRWGRPVSRLRKGRVHRPGRVPRGYLTVSVNNETVLVHRLVLAAFRGSPSPGQEANHLNGHRADNRPDNLEWTTRSGNELHAYRVLGKHTWNKDRKYVNYVGLRTRRRNYLAKCLELLETQKSGATLSDMSKKFNISERQVSQRLRDAREVISNG